MREMKFTAFFLMLLGTLGLFAGYRSLVLESVHSDIGCRIICGLALMFQELFGAQVGLVIQAFIFIIIGISFIAVGIKIWRK